MDTKKRMVLKNPGGRKTAVQLDGNKVYMLDQSSNSDLQHLQTYEYRINGFIIYQKLLFSKYIYSGEDEYYDVEDGIIKENMITERYLKDKDSIIGGILKDPKDEIKELIDKCKWHELKSYKIRYFILSNHPEIFSKNSLNNFFEAELKRIELGIKNVLELCNKYNFKLEFLSAHSFGLFQNNEEYDFYDLLFTNEKEKTDEERTVFNKELELLLKEINCERYEIERAKSIIKRIELYLEKLK